MAKPQPVPKRVKSVMEDPSAQAVARVYADAFVKAGQTVGLAGALDEFSSFVDEVLDKNADFARLMYSGLLSRDEKVAMIDRVIAPRGSELFTNFLRVLARHDRLELLPSILHESKLMQEALSDQKRVRVTTAVELTPQLEETIRKRLDDLLPFQPILETEIDPSLIGGIVIQIGDKVYDSSLKVRMKQFRNKLRQRSLNEIQSGRNRFSSPEGN